MLICSGTKQQFNQDVTNHTIAEAIEKQFEAKGIYHDNVSEFMAWENVLTNH